jgi:nucleoside-diphosphate-sugar epimerase
MVIYGDGLQKRDFVHVSDVVEAMWLALTKPGAEGVFNIASGQPVSINELAKVMSELVDIDPPHMIHRKPREGDIRVSHGDCSKAKKTLGFTPETELKDGLSGLLDRAYVIVDSGVVTEEIVL